MSKVKCVPLDFENIHDEWLYEISSREFCDYLCDDKTCECQTLDCCFQEIVGEKKSKYNN